MDNKRASDSFQRKQKEKSNNVWKHIKKFILEISEKNVCEITTYKEE